METTESHPSHHGSAQISEAVDSRLQLLKASDLDTLRSAGTWRTSLMGLDLQKLEALATHKELRECVKVLYIEDDFGKDAETATTDTPNIWPRHGNGKVITEALGLKTLQSMLLGRHLGPDKIEPRDCRTMLAPSDPELAADLVRDIIEGADLAITSISLQRDGPPTTIITAEFSVQHQGQGAGLSRLHHAKLLLRHDLSSYWCTQILHHAPALKQLEFFFFRNRRDSGP